MKVGILGAGVMGRAILKFFSDDEVFVCDRHSEKIKDIDSSKCFTNPDEMIQRVDILLFAIKPQDFDLLEKSLGISLQDKLVLSLMAGITLEHLKKVTKSNRVIRFMPNLAVQVSKGVTGWIPTSEVSSEDLQFAKNLFNKMGVEVRLEEERLIDVVTAISGSGPAYFFYLAEALTKAGVNMGLSEMQARKLAEGTLIGSGKLLESENKSSAEWKKEIAVPSGTTEAAINAFREEDFEKIVLKGAKAGFNRAEELNQK